ncbi:MAG: amidohydrolase family protein, partial [Pseudomonadota bacterium]|nr:amidohydrolase family protein [Pseudomonadota bacterium]
FAEAAFGAVGLDTFLSVALNLVHNQNIDLARLSQVLSEMPAKLLGLPEGKLIKGAPADFILVDPHLNWKVEPAKLHSRSKNSPFERRTLEGRAIQTWVAGRKIYSYVD